MKESIIKILLVEDDTNLGFIIQDQLKSANYHVTLCLDGNEGLKRFNEELFHLCIFDIMMPNKDGITLARDIRQLNKNIPILFLSAKSSDEDKIEGLKAGADDYITKPFNAIELELRVAAMLKRVDLSVSNEDTVYNIGEYSFDTENFELTHDNFQKKLTKKEAQILTILCEFKNKVVAREIVLKGVWGQDDYFVGRSLDVFITKLRKYLKEDPKIQISNVHGIGFKLEVQ